MVFSSQCVEAATYIGTKLILQPISRIQQLFTAALTVFSAVSEAILGVMRPAAAGDALSISAREPQNLKPSRAPALVMPALRGARLAFEMWSRKPDTLTRGVTA